MIAMGFITLALNAIYNSLFVNKTVQLPGTKFFH